MFSGKDKKIFDKIVKQLNKNVAETSINMNSKNSFNGKKTLKEYGAKNLLE